jgi:2-haloalkanoic acid dehalogenase type II
MSEHVIDRPRAVLLDLLMAVMNSLETWALAARDRDTGLAWRDAVTDRMRAAGPYVEYIELVADGAAAVGLDPASTDRLLDAWREMKPWPDAAHLAALDLPYAFVTNCSEELAMLAARRSGLAPRFTLSAERAGWYKPRGEVYRQAAERIGASPAQVLFVAGAPYDAQGARQAGFQSALVVRRPLVEAPDPGIRRIGGLADLFSSHA